MKLPWQSPAKLILLISKQSLIFSGTAVSKHDTLGKWVRGAIFGKLFIVAKVIVDRHCPEGKLELRRGYQLPMVLYIVPVVL